jgi:hypothetical protein
MNYLEIVVEVQVFTLDSYFFYLYDYPLWFNYLKISIAKSHLSLNSNFEQAFLDFYPNSIAKLSYFLIKRLVPIHILDYH